MCIGHTATVGCIAGGYANAQFYSAGNWTAGVLHASVGQQQRQPEERRCQPVPDCARGWVR
jgi:hypothetical protein